MSAIAPEARFERALETLRSETVGGMQFLYAYFAIHAVAGGEQRIRRALNVTPLLWNTILAALQGSAIITLGRIFDRRSPHNVGQVLKLAQEHADIFSIDALAKRKTPPGGPRPSWLDDYLLRAHVPDANDFRRLCAHVRRRREVYDEIYRPIRNKVFAHKELADDEAVSKLFAKTRIREIELIYAFLSALHEALWQLFQNGRKPRIRIPRHSVQYIRKRPSPLTHNVGPQEQIVHETERFLNAIADAALAARPAPRKQSVLDVIANRRRKR